MLKYILTRIGIALLKAGLIEFQKFVDKLGDKDKELLTKKLNNEK